MPDIQIFPLVEGLMLPRAAPARIRSKVPPGYGVEEHCAPFIAATSLGALIPSPIRFGICLPEQVPHAARAFRSPLERPLVDGSYADPRVFYVLDDADMRFAGNAFHVPQQGEPSDSIWYEPGISFFDRQDQIDLFKVHLPYVWRTARGIDTVFLPPINRDLGGLTLLCGVVETDWYANPVNLVFRKPPAEYVVHVPKGAWIAQGLLLPRHLRRAELEMLVASSEETPEFMARLEQWRDEKGKHRDAYKRLSRRQRATAAASR